MASKFDVGDLQTIQSMAYPLIKVLGGPDIPALIGSQAHYLTEIGTVLRECAELFEVTGAALEDGILTQGEIDQIIAEADDPGQALDALRAKA